VGGGEIEIEIVYNMYRMRRFTPHTVRAGCCLWALPTMSYMDLTSQGYTVNHLNPTSPWTVGGFTPPPGSFARRGEGGVQLGACEGAVCGGAAGGHAGFDAAYE
jgi:hypothetical protein